MKNPPINLSEIEVIPIKPQSKGLLGFCAFVIDEKFYIGSVGIYSRPDGGLRLTYPKKGSINCCFPLNKEVGNYINKTIEKYFYTLMKHNYGYNDESKRNV